MNSLIPGKTADSTQDNTPVRNINEGRLEIRFTVDKENDVEEGQKEWTRPCAEECTVVFTVLYSVYSWKDGIKNLITNQFGRLPTC
jgi:hypothetical protein